MQTRETSTSEKHLPTLMSLFSKELQQGLIYLFNTSRKLQHAAQQVLAGSSFEEIENPIGEGPEQPAPGEPALNRDWAGQSPDPASGTLGLYGRSFFGDKIENL